MILQDSCWLRPSDIAADSVFMYLLRFSKFFIRVIFYSHVYPPT